MTENQMHFSPFQINTQLFLEFFLEFFFKMATAAILEVRFAPKTIGFFHYVLSMAMPNMKLIGEFMTPLKSHKLFEHFYAKGIFVTKLWSVQALTCCGSGGATKNITMFSAN